MFQGAAIIRPGRPWLNCNVYNNLRNGNTHSVYLIRWMDRWQDWCCFWVCGTFDGILFHCEQYWISHQKNSFYLSGYFVPFICTAHNVISSWMHPLLISWCSNAVMSPFLCDNPASIKDPAINFDNGGTIFAIFTRDICFHHFVSSTLGCVKNSTQCCGHLVTGNLIPIF